MRFGLVGHMGPRMRQVVGFGDRSTGRGNFEGECGAVKSLTWPVPKLLWIVLFAVVCGIEFNNRTCNR